MKRKPFEKAALATALLLVISLTATACVAPSASPAPAAEPAASPIAAAAQPTQTISIVTGEYQVKTAQEAKQIMDANPEAIIVDVREADEYAQGHIPNAILLPVGSVSQLAGEVLPDKNALILVYCRSGRRSEAAARALISLGYTRVVDFGGINSWPYDVVTEAPSAT